MLDQFSQRRKIPLELAHLTELQAGPELHAGRAEYYYQPAGFAGRVFLLRALGPH